MRFLKRLLEPVATAYRELGPVRFIGGVIATMVVLACLNAWLLLGRGAS